MIKTNTTYVYVIGGLGTPVKIGISQNTKQRLKNIKKPLASKLSVIHEIEYARDDAAVVEAATHLALSSRRVHGEWFDVSPDVARNAIVSSAKEYGIEPASSLVSSDPDRLSSDCVWISPDQCRAARAYLDWEQRDLAGLINVTPDSILNFERRIVKIAPVIRAKIRRAFSAHGLEFNGRSLRLPYAGGD